MLQGKGKKEGSIKLKAIKHYTLAIGMKRVA
jgi:hypothetical protein